MLYNVIQLNTLRLENIWKVDLHAETWGGNLQSSQMPYEMVNLHDLCISLLFL